MSFVNFIVTDKFISAISDGQGTDMRSYNAVKDDCKKIRKYDKFIIGGTGDFYVLDSIFEGLVGYEKLTFKNACRSLTDMAEKYKNHKSPSGKNIGSTIMLSGFDEGKGKIFCIQMYNSKVEYTTMLANTYCTSYPDDFSREVNDIVYDKLKFKTNGRIYLKDVQKAQKESLLEVAKVSKTVNNTIFLEVLFHP